MSWGTEWLLSSERQGPLARDRDNLFCTAACELPSLRSMTLRLWQTLSNVASPCLSLHQWNAVGSWMH